ncbi:hypothetical protein SASPL_120513 [Salvia splendens]|uniref:Uncharacterized protein n=1 Tax=Salvia splendens TaxID=180675 RepID=A0A8X8XUF1_SALSN|nr:hypothetical protein SASPL_120513 [Salvia splendens]
MELIVDDDSDESVKSCSINAIERLPNRDQVGIEEVFTKEGVLRNILLVMGRGLEDPNVGISFLVTSGIMITDAKMCQRRAWKPYASANFSYLSLLESTSLKGWDLDVMLSVLIPWILITHDDLVVVKFVITKVDEELLQSSLAIAFGAFCVVVRSTSHAHVAANFLYEWDLGQQISKLQAPISGFLLHIHRNYASVNFCNTSHEVAAAGANLEYNGLAMVTMEIVEQL